MEKKRYILFAYDDYYPEGGMGDVKKSFEKEEYEEVKSTCGGIYEWYQIFDTETFEIHKASVREIPKI